MTFTIDTSKNKALAYPLDPRKPNSEQHGYELRLVDPTTIVVHDTEGPNGQSFESAMEYLYTTDKVSVPYLVGRDGRIMQFLDPRRYAAWHAGQAIAAYQNQHSIGIELLHAKGDAWTVVQKAALAWLLQFLMHTYVIPLTLIDTHGQIALPGPYDRKTDPSNWPHADFIVWRNALVITPPPLPIPARMIVVGLPIHEAPNVTSPVALGGKAMLVPGTRIAPDQIKDGWAHVPEGFIDMNGMEPE